jgi:hypothetical protein
VKLTPRKQVRQPLLLPAEPGLPPAVNHADLPRLQPPQACGPVVFRMGTAWFDRAVPFAFSTEYARVHLAVLGESGSGKSKFLEQLVRFLLLAGEGGVLIDPSNDLADAVLSFVAYRLKIGDEALVRRCHVITATEGLAFRLDPFATMPTRRQLPPALYYNRLRAKADMIFRNVQRRQTAGDLDVQKRLKKRARAVFMACGVDLDGNGAHLGLDKAYHLADPNSEGFSHFLAMVWKVLPDRVRATFREIAQEHAPGGKVSNSARENWASTQNLLDDFLGGIVEMCVAPGPSLDLAKARKNREFVICRMKENVGCSREQSLGLSGLIIDSHLDAAETEDDSPPHERTSSNLLIDECGDHITERLCLALRNDRKFEERITLGAQNYMTLCSENVALGDYVLTQCGTVLCFAQRGQSADFVAERMFRGNESYTRRMRKVQRQYGWFAVQTPDVSVSGNRTTGAADASTWSGGETHSVSDTRGRGKVRSWADSSSESESDGIAESLGEVRQLAQNTGLSQSPIVMDGVVIGNAPVQSKGNSTSSGLQSTHGFLLEEQGQFAQRGRRRERGYERGHGPRPVGDARRRPHRQPLGRGGLDAVAQDRLRAQPRVGARVGRRLRRGRARGAACRVSALAALPGDGRVFRLGQGMCLRLSGEDRPGP